MIKNIYILPTDKPSKFFLGNNKNFVFGMVHTSIQSKNNDFTNQNIFITNDEKIKEGDWFLNTINGNLDKCDDLIYEKNINLSNWCKKIILTTDQDLIKDGVQAIDDEFLEWFVKNSNCEEIEVIKGVFDLNPTETMLLKKKYVPESTFDTYKIIIPKEEPKPETLEEAAEKHKQDITDAWSINEHCKSSFIAGAKWRQKRSYSEEELLEVVNWYLDEFLDDALGLNGKDAEKKVEHLKSKGLTKEVLKYWSDNFKKK